MKRTTSDRDTCLVGQAEKIQYFQILELYNLATHQLTIADNKLLIVDDLNQAVLLATEN